MDSFDILVIMLSVTLMLFLVTAIIATVIFIKLLKKISLATESAKQAVENVEAMTGTLKNVANGSVVAGVISSLFEKLKTKSSKTGKR